MGLSAVATRMVRSTVLRPRYYYPSRLLLRLVSTVTHHTLYLRPNSCGGPPARHCIEVLGGLDANIPLPVKGSVGKHQAWALMHVD